VRGEGETHEAVQAPGSGRESFLLVPGKVGGGAAEAHGLHRQAAVQADVQRADGIRGAGWTGYRSIRVKGFADNVSAGLARASTRPIGEFKQPLRRPQRRDYFGLVDHSGRESEE